MSKDNSKSDLKRLDALGDQDIDYSDVPELDADFLRETQVVVPPGKKKATLGSSERVFGANLNATKDYP